MLPGRRPDDGPRGSSTPWMTCRSLSSLSSFVHPIRSPATPIWIGSAAIVCEELKGLVSNVWYANVGGRHLRWHRHGAFRMKYSLAFGG